MRRSVTRYLLACCLLVVLPISALGQPTSQQCYLCHSNAGLQKTITVSGNTEIVPLHVDSTLFKQGTHGRLECVQCHTDITESNLFSHKLSKTYGSWARFSKSDTTLNTDGEPRTRNYYTAASMSCAGCHANKAGFAASSHHTIPKLKGAHLHTVNGESVGEAYDKTCSRCHTTCATCHFKSNFVQAFSMDVMAIWDSLQTLGEGPFPNAGKGTEWSMDWTMNVASHQFLSKTELEANSDVCRSCHVGFYRPPAEGFLSEVAPFPKAKATNIKRHPQYYELQQSSSHKTLTCAKCHTDVHSYSGNQAEWQEKGDAQCQDCHQVADHYAAHTSVDCISCHFTGFARSQGQDGHDVWRWPENNRVRPLAVKYNEALSWYPHNITKPEAATLCAGRCHYEGNLVGVGVLSSVADREPIPQAFELSQNYPNPFNPSTTIRYTLPTRQHVRISIYDVLGKEVATLVNQDLEAGSHTIQWSAATENGQTVESGLYLYILRAGNYTAHRKMVLIR